MIIFRIRLKKKRIELGLTQQQLGENIFLSKGEICAYEKGKRIPPLDVLIRIANFLEVDFLWLIGMELEALNKNKRIVSLSNDDLNIIKAFKKNSDLYEKLLENPDRVVNQISGIMKKMK